jgi:hypothetical protein
MLYGVNLAHGSFVGIEASIRASATLAQQIPALIEMLLDPMQPGSFFFGQLRCALTLTKLMLLVR